MKKYISFEFIRFFGPSEVTLGVLCALKRRPGSQNSKRAGASVLKASMESEKRERRGGAPQLEFVLGGKGGPRSRCPRARCP